MQGLSCPRGWYPGRQSVHSDSLYSLEKGNPFSDEGHLLAQALAKINHLINLLRLSTAYGGNEGATSVNICVSAIKIAG